MADTWSDDDLIQQAISQAKPTDVSNLPGAVLKSYEPTWRDRVANYLLGGERPSPERERFVEGLVGSRGLGTTGPSVADVTPAGMAFGAQEAAREGDYKGVAMAALPMGGAAGSKLKNVEKAGLDAAERAIARLSASEPKLSTRAIPELPQNRNTQVFPELQERYPTIAPPVNAIDKNTGNPYLAKQLSDEALAVQKARIAVQKDIDAGNYSPYFKLSERADVNPADYPEHNFETTKILKQRPETVEKYETLARDPESLKRLTEGYKKGLEQKEGAENWYFMKQLQDEFVEEYGPKKGKALFKERFADPMAATTGGADPTSNLMMAHYGNYLKNKGITKIPPAYEMPFPIGGRYVTGNMEQYRKMIMENAGIDPVANPKRYNFSGNFLGKKGATLDEQMSGAWDPKMGMPPTGSYGHYESALADEAAKQGASDPRYFQEVAWAGLKDLKTKGGFKAQPMIGIVNEAIERTSRLTGMSPKEVVRRGLVRGEIPLYGAAGFAALNNLDSFSKEDEPNFKKGGRAMGNNAIDNALRMALGGDAEIEMPRSLKELQDWKKTHPSSRKANMDKLFSDRKSGIEGAEPIAMPADLDELLNYLRSQHNYGGRTGFGFGGDSDVAEGSSYTENTDSGGYSGDWGSYGDFGSAKVKDYGDADTVKASIGNDASDEERAINQARLISGASDSAARQLLDREDVTNIPSPRDFTPAQTWGSMNRQPQLGGVNAEKSLLEQAMDPSNSYGMAYGNLVGKNFTRAGAAGLLGNAMYESGGMDPTAINPKSGATGLFQHLGDRKTGLLNAVNAAGLTGQDLKDALEGTEMAQLAYGLNEIATKPEYMETKMALQTATDPYTAAQIVMKNFERPGAVDEFLSGSKRAAYANQIYNNVPSAATNPRENLPDTNFTKASGDATGLNLKNIFGSTDDRVAELENQGRYAGGDRNAVAAALGVDPSQLKSRIVDYGNGQRVDYYTKDLGQALIGDVFKGLGDTVSGLFNKTASTYSGPKGPNMDVVNADIANRNYIESHKYGPYNNMTAEEYRAVYGGKDSNDLIKAAVNAAQPTTPAAPYTTELGKLTLQLPSVTGQTAQEWADANAGGDLSKVHARVKYVNGAPRLEYYTV